MPVDECCYTDAELEDGLLKISDRFIDDSHFESELFRLTQKKDRTGLDWQRSFFSENYASLVDYFKVKPLIFTEENSTSKLIIEEFNKDATTQLDAIRKNEKVVSEQADLFFSNSELDKLIYTDFSIEISSVTANSPGYTHFNMTPQIAGSGNLGGIADVLEQLKLDGFEVYFISEHQGKAERLRKLSEDMAVTDVLVGSISCGFIEHSGKIAVFTDHQIFNQAARSQSGKKFKGGGVSIPNFEALTRGDTIVHQEYGLGVYVGIKRINIEKHAEDCIILQYRGK